VAAMSVITRIAARKEIQTARAKLNE